MIKRTPIMAARRNPTMVANPSRHYPLARRGGSKNLMHYVKNPQDFEVAGIKVLPLAAGAAGAIAIYNSIPLLPGLKTLLASQPKIQPLVPGLVTIGASWAIHKYLGGKHPMVNQISSQMAAAGVVLMVNGLVASYIDQGLASVANAINKSAPVVNPGVTAPTGTNTGMSGGGFRTLQGGGFAKQLQGGQFQNFNQAFTPVEGTALSGFVMSGQAARSNQPPLGLGARHGGGLGGINLSDFAE